MIRFLIGGLCFGLLFALWDSYTSLQFDSVREAVLCLLLAGALGSFLGLSLFLMLPFILVNY